MVKYMKLSIRTKETYTLVSIISKDKYICITERLPNICILYMYIIN